MNRLRKIALRCGLVLVLAWQAVMGSALMGENYNACDPYADTQFARHYSVKRFERLKTGMSLSEAVKTVGKPLYVQRDSLGDTAVRIMWNYTQDGKLLDRKNTDWLLVNDLAWYQSSFEVTHDSLVGRIFTCWIYD